MPAGHALLEAECGRPAHCAAPASVVIDTNVWLDLFVFQDRAARGLGQALQDGSLLAVRSQRTDAELLRVLARPRFTPWLPATEIPVLLQRWQALALCIAERAPAPWTCSDPDDQKFLDLAYSAHAQALYTKDRALLRLAPGARRLGLQIIQPDAHPSWHAWVGP